MATIAELKPGMFGVPVTALISEATAFTYTKGTALKFIIMDATGSVEFIDWNQSYKSQLCQGCVYDLALSTSEYNGKLQATVKQFKLCTDKTPMDFAKRSRFSESEQRDVLDGLIEDMEDPYIKFLSHQMLDGEYYKMYMMAPAARAVHSAYVGGLAEHAIHMARLALGIHALYKLHFLPDLNQDKLIFGCLFHDWGKMLEYDVKTPAYPTTLTGTLTPHIVLGPAVVYSHTEHILMNAENDGSPEANLIAEVNDYVCDPLGDSLDLGAFNHIVRTRDELMHIIAAHHGQLEWGSPVVPSTAEAIILHHLDNMDSKVLHAISLMQKPAAPGANQELTERSFFEKTAYVRQRYL